MKWLRNKILYFLFWLLYKITGAKTRQGLKNIVKYYTDNECSLDDLI